MTIKQNFIDASGNWRKVGHGMGLRFSLSLSHFNAILAEAPPQYLAPYRLAYVKKTPSGKRRFTDSIVWRDAPDFSLAAADRPGNIFLGSQLLMSRVVLDHALEYPEATWSLNGMILIQWKNRPPPNESSIGIVPKVSLLDGSGLIHHLEYEKVFRALKTAIRKAVARDASGNAEKNKPLGE